MADAVEVEFDPRGLAAMLKESPEVKKAVHDTTERICRLANAQVDASDDQSRNPPYVAIHGKSKGFPHGAVVSATIHGANAQKKRNVLVRAAKASGAKVKVMR